MTKEKLINELGKLSSEQGFNLSRFIDPEFLDKCVAPVQNINF